MRRLAIALPAFALVWVSLGCDKEDPDPLGSQCKTSCKLDPDHVCYSSVAECESKCRTQATQDEKKYRIGCGTCIAEQYSTVYSVDPNPPCDTTPTAKCCWGIKPILETDAACLTKCFEPDGSVP